jgi:hypothetical protein
LGGSGIGGPTFNNENNININSGVGQLGGLGSSQSN